MLNACLVEDNSPCNRAGETHVSFLNFLDKSGMYHNAALQKNPLPSVLETFCAHTKDWNCTQVQGKGGFPAR